MFVGRKMGIKRNVYIKNKHEEINPQYTHFY